MVPAKNIFYAPLDVLTFSLLFHNHVSWLSPRLSLWGVSATRLEVETTSPVQQAPELDPNLTSSILPSMLICCPPSDYGTACILCYKNYYPAEQTLFNYHSTLMVFRLQVLTIRHMLGDTQCHLTAAIPHFELRDLPRLFRITRLRMWGCANPAHPTAHPYTQDLDSAKGLT
jgi:hypothetical protein